MDRKGTIRIPLPADAEALRRIDLAGLETGHASFRSEPHDWETFEASYLTGRGLAFVAGGPNGIVAWAGVSPVSARAVYSGVGEVSIYISTEARGAGLGRDLLTALIEASEKVGYWTRVAQIFPENRASAALHRKCGFHEVGRRSRLGRMGYGPVAGRDAVRKTKRDYGNRMIRGLRRSCCALAVLAQQVLTV